MRLLILSHTPHYNSPDGVVGWGATVREIDALSRLFTSTVHVAILHKDQAAPESCLPYQSPRVTLRLLPPAGGSALMEKLGILLRYPEYWSVIREEMQNADFVHVRCPANISLLGLLALAIARKPAYRWVKYAGNWVASPRAPLSYALQRWLLRRNVPRAQVSVNGIWSGQERHVHSFFNPSFSAEEARQAAVEARGKTLRARLQLLFVGRLEPAKGVDTVLQVAHRLKSQGIRFDLNLVGGGPHQQTYRVWVEMHNLEAEVHFIDWLPPAQIAQHYRRAHFLLLPSVTEGWPKVISEGMAYGVVPLASAISSIPQYLADFGCGRALPIGDVDGYEQAIRDYLSSPESWLTESRAGMETARHFTYEAHLQQVARMAKAAWGLDLPPVQDEANG